MDFEQLYREQYEAVRRYAVRRVAAERVPDVVHETFLIAWRRQDDVPAAAPLPWLLGVARNVVLHDRRAAARRLRLTARVAAEPAATVEAGDAPPLDGALAGLSVEDRDLLGLVYWDGLSPAEAASVLGCTPATLRVRLHRARRRLADLLDAADHPLEEAS